MRQITRDQARNVSTKPPARLAGGVQSRLPAYTRPTARWALGHVTAGDDCVLLTPRSESLGGHLRGSTARLREKIVLAADRSLFVSCHLAEQLAGAALGAQADVGGVTAS